MISRWLMLEDHDLVYHAIEMNLIREFSECSSWAYVTMLWSLVELFIRAYTDQSQGDGYCIISSTFSNPRLSGPKYLPSYELKQVKHDAQYTLAIAFEGQGREIFGSVVYQF